MQYKDIGAAVVGSGFIGPVHVEGLKRLSVDVRGILGSRPEKSDRAARELNLPRAYQSYDELLEDDSVHVVHLAVPNVLHYDMSKKAIAAGKHVMCEKPLAMDAKESAELVELAAASKVHCGVTYNQRFYPLNLETRARIQNGEIGDVLAITGGYIQDWLLYDTDYNWRVLAEAGGELRAVSDIGTHWIDNICSMTGLEVEEVFADLKTVHPIRKRPLGEVETFSGKVAKKQDSEDVAITTDDWGAIIIRFKGGARGLLCVSQVTAGTKNSMHYQISGSKGSITWDSQDPNNMRLGHRNVPNQHLTRDPSLISDLSGTYTDYPGGHNEGYPDTFKQCFRAFYDAIIDGKSEADAIYPNFTEGHKEIVICDAILQSHRTQSWVKI